MLNIVKVNVIVNVYNKLMMGFNNNEFIWIIVICVFK